MNCTAGSEWVMFCCVPKVDLLVCGSCEFDDIKHSLPAVGWHWAYIP